MKWTHSGNGLGHPYELESQGTVIAGGGWAGDKEYSSLVFLREPRQFASSLDFALLQAAKDGDPKKMKMALEMGADPNFAWTSSGQEGSALHALIQEGRGQRQKCLELLLPVADLAMRNVVGHTPLMSAVIYKPAEWAAAIIERSDGLAQDDGGMTALMHAACRGLAKTAQAILSKSDPMARNNSGETALMLAAETACGDSDRVVEMLVGCSDARAKDHFGRDAMMRAAKRDNNESHPGFRALMAASDPFACDKMGLDAVFFEKSSRTKFNNKESTPVAHWVKREQERRELAALVPAASAQGQKPRL